MQNRNPIDPPVKPRDRAQTRERILQAAMVAFARRGYAAANVRDIAAEAGITAALVVRYFGSKQKLFAAAVAETFDLGQAFVGVERATLGAAMVAPLFSRQQEGDLLSMMLLAAVDPAVNRLTRRLARERMLKPMAALIGGVDAERRASLALSFVTGLWLYRFLLPLEPLAGRSDPETTERVAELLQKIIDGAA